MCIVAALAACDGTENVEWRFVADDAIAPRIDAIEAEIVAGGCSSTSVIFETEIVVAASRATTPPVLEAGTYGMRGRARDANCSVIGEGCVTVEVPVGDDVVVPLTALATPTDGCTPSDPGPADVSFTLGARVPLSPISPLIYGVVDPVTETGRTLRTLNAGSDARWSTLDWETGASNNGRNFTPRWSNTFVLAGSERAPGAAALQLLQAFEGLSGLDERGAIVPLSLMGRVAADGDDDGDVRYAGATPIPTFADTRFRTSSFTRGTGVFPETVDLTDGVVYQDELVDLVARELPGCAACAKQVIWSLDYQPDMWEFSYAPCEDGGLPPSCDAGDPGLDPESRGISEAEWFARSTDLARAIRAADEDAIVIGPSTNGFASSRLVARQPMRFFGRYVDHLRAESGAGRPLVDAIALAWPTEITSPARANCASPSGSPIAGMSGSEGRNERLDAARSLYDPGYDEHSWVSCNPDFGAPIRLLPRLRELAGASVDVDLAITGYDFGGEDDISGAIAVAEALGAFGREGVRFAYLDEGGTFAEAALAMYRSYDGAGGAFGDLAMPAQVDDASVEAGMLEIDRAVAFGSAFAEDASRVVVVAINRTAAPLSASIRVIHRRRLSNAEVFVLTSDAPMPAPLGAMRMTGRNSLFVTLPPASVATIALSE